MTPAIEDLVRAVQERHAELAPAPEHVATALPVAQARYRVRRRRTVSAVAAALVLAVAMPVALNSLRSDHRVAAVQSGASRALRYRPRWLPSGLVERMRAVTGRQVTRMWSAEKLTGQGTFHTDDTPQVTFTVEPLDSTFHPVGSRVTINGTTGYLQLWYDGSQFATVRWAVGGTMFAVTAWRGVLPDPTAVVAIARSVVPDPDVLTAPLPPTPLPFGLQSDDVELIGNSDHDWIATATLRHSQADDEQNDIYQITMAARTSPRPRATPAVPGLPGTPVTVGGHPGRLVLAGGGLGATIVDIDIAPGRTLTVTSTGDDVDELLAVAAAVARAKPLDVSWVGR